MVKRSDDSKSKGTKIKVGKLGVKKETVKDLTLTDAQRVKGGGKISGVPGIPDPKGEWAGC